MVKRTVSPGLRRVLVLLFVALFTLFFYTVLHESGHAVAGLLSGQKLLVFDVNLLAMKPHVRMAGDLSAAQRSAQTVAGVALPLAAWAAFMLAAPRRANPVLEMLKLLSTLAVLNSALPWIVFPALVAAGQAPPVDDVLNFLGASGATPLLVAGVFLALYIGGWGLFLARIEGVRQVVARLVGRGDEFTSASLRRALPGLTAVFAVGVLGVMLLGVALGPAPDPFSPPPGYDLAATVDLAQQA